MIILWVYLIPLIYIDNNISNKITIEDLENKFFYNRYYIMKLFKKEMGITLINYINSIRIYNSITLIKESNNSLLNIAFKCGFYSIEYFSETFKKIIGVNPEIVKQYLRKKMVVKKMDIINNSILNLYNLKKFKERYLLNRKPDNPPIKKLSIFK